MSVFPPDKRVFSEEEFGHLFARCRRPFVRIADSYIHDTAIAEDLVNDSFLRLWERRGEIQTNNFEAYLFQIVVHKCLDYLKSEKVQTLIRQNMHKAGYRMLVREISSLESADPGKLYLSEIERLAEEVMESMPELTRQIFIANRVHGKTYREIADVYDISVRRVTSEIQRALSMFRSVLKDYLPVGILLLILKSGFFFNIAAYSPDRPSRESMSKKCRHEETGCISDYSCRVSD